MRVAGLDAQAWVFEPKDGLRYGHKFWVDVATGLIAQGAHRRRAQRACVEQFAFTEVDDRRARSTARWCKPTWPPAPPGMAGPAIGAGRGRTARKPAGRSRGCRPDSSRSSTGYRRVRGKRAQGRAPRLFGRPRRRLGVRRARGARAPPRRILRSRAGSTSTVRAGRRHICDRARARRPRSRCARSPIPVARR
mgnify:CR=1 FL=1